MANSLAKHADYDLKAGDVVLEINNVSVKDMTKEQAMQQVIRHRDRLELLVQKSDGLTCSVPISGSAFDGLSDIPNTTLRNRTVRDESPARDNNRTFADPDMREVSIHKTSRSLGIRLEGGNDAGIFIANIQQNSAAEGKGLMIGDRILEINGKSFKNATHEEAINTIMRTRQNDIVTLVVKNNKELYEKIVETGVRDKFYIRTHFKFDGTRTQKKYDTQFNKGEVFLVTDTLYRGQLGTWLASRIDSKQKALKKGIIPNRVHAQSYKDAQDAKLEQRRQGHVNKLLNRFKTGNTLTKPMKSQPTKQISFEPYLKCFETSNLIFPIQIFDIL